MYEAMSLTNVAVIGLLLIAFLQFSAIMHFIDTIAELRSRNAQLRYELHLWRNRAVTAHWQRIENIADEVVA